MNKMLNEQTEQSVVFIYTLIDENCANEMTDFYIYELQFVVKRAIISIVIF